MNDWPVPDVRLSCITGESSHAIQIFGWVRQPVPLRRARSGLSLKGKHGDRPFCRVLHGTADKPIATHFDQTDIVKERRETARRADDQVHQQAARVLSRSVPDSGKPHAERTKLRQIECRWRHVGGDRRARPPSLPQRRRNGVLRAAPVLRSSL